MGLVMMFETVVSVLGSLLFAYAAGTSDSNNDTRKLNHRLSVASKTT